MKKLSTPELAAVVAKGLFGHVGKQQAIRSKDIVTKMRDKGYDIDGALLRECIHYLRTKKSMLICGDGSGYYMAKNEIESIAQIRSMKGRVNAIQEACNALQTTHQNTFKQAQIF